jgi:hypothetical protein
MYFSPSYFSTDRSNELRLVQAPSVYASGQLKTYRGRALWLSPWGGDNGSHTTYLVGGNVL